METVALAPKLPETLDGIQEGEVLRIPASWDEYLDLLETTPYTIQFLGEEIIIMGQATDIHEQLVIRLGKLFALYFDELDGDYRVLGSNVKLVTPGQVGDFNADLSVVRGPSEYGPTKTGRNSTARITNPYIVVEVLSKSTRNFDLGGKLLAYAEIPSLQHVLLVDQHTVEVHISSRTDQPNQWLTTRYNALSDVVAIDGFDLKLDAVYRKILG